MRTRVLVDIGIAFGLTAFALLLRQWVERLIERFVQTESVRTDRQHVNAKKELPIMTDGSPPHTHGHT
jgi:hypothetical protein